MYPNKRLRKAKAEFSHGEDLLKLMASEPILCAYMAICFTFCHEKWAEFGVQLLFIIRRPKFSKFFIWFVYCIGRFGSVLEEKLLPKIEPN